MLMETKQQIEHFEIEEKQKREAFAQQLKKRGFSSLLFYKSKSESVIHTNFGISDFFAYP